MTRSGRIGARHIINLTLRLIGAWAWLWCWQAFHTEAHCLVVLGMLVPVVFFVSLGLTENALLRRRAILSAYLTTGSGLFRLLRGGVLLVTWQMLKAVLIALILAVAALTWPTSTWQLLAADALLLALLHTWLERRVANHARPGLSGMFVRRILAPINTVVFSLVLAAATFYSPHPDLRILTLSEAMLVEITEVDARCEGVGVLARAAAAADGANWWLAQSWLSHEEIARWASIGWLAFLALSAAFVWGYSRFLLGTLTSWPRLFGLLDRQVLRGEPPTSRL